MSGPLSRLSTVLLFSLTLAPCAWSGGMQAVKVKGRLSDAQGNPLTATASLEFMILDLDRGGEAVWKEISEVSAAAGEYAAALGRANPLPPQDSFRKGWRLVVRPPTASGWTAEPPTLERPENPQRTRINRMLEILGVGQDRLDQEPSAKLLGLFGLRPCAPPPEKAHGEAPPETERKDLELYGYGTESSPLPRRIVYDAEEDVTLEGLQRADKVVRREEALLRKRLSRMARELKDRPSEAKAPAIPITVTALPR